MSQHVPRLDAATRPGDFVPLQDRIARLSSGPQSAASALSLAVVDACLGGEALAEALRYGEWLGG